MASLSQATRNVYSWSLKVLLLTPVLATVTLILWTTCLTRLSSPGNGSFLLLLPISRVTLLLSWILASIQSGQSFQVNVIFYQRLNHTFVSGRSNNLVK